MNNKFSVAELAKLLGVSVNTTWKKINKLGLSTVKEQVNNREITFIILSEDDYEKLMPAGVHNHVNNVDYEDNEIINNPTQSVQSQQEMISLMDKFINYQKEVNEYIMKAGQVKLLEDSEHRTKEDYYRVKLDNERLNNLVNDLQEENQELRQQLEQERSKPFWKKKVL